MSKTKAVEALSEVKYIGETRAESLFDDFGVETVEGLIEMAESGELSQMKGIGESRAKTILESAREVAEKSPGKKEESKPKDDSSESKEATREKQSVKAESKKQPIERFLERLRCPACGYNDLERGPATLSCGDCGREYNFYNGVADLAPPHPTGRNLTQRVMDSRFYSQFYEDVMRPKLTSLVSERTMQEEYELSAEYLELDGESTVLDVACGTANFTRHFAEKLHSQVSEENDEYLVTGMDISWSMLEKARTILTQKGLDREIYLIRGDATRIPVQRAGYNRLHCAGALHMVNNIDEALRNFSRVLEPGGICVIGTFLLGDGMIRRFFKKVAEIPSKFHWFSKQELYKRLERAGFNVVDSSVAGDAITVKARRTQ